MGEDVFEETALRSPAPNIKTNNITTSTTATATPYTNPTNATQQPITKWFSISPSTTNHVEIQPQLNKQTKITSIKTGLQLLNKPIAETDKTQQQH
jgi:uncharacterized protein (DUF3084 family)